MASERQQTTGSDMREVEVKVLEIDRASVESRLAELGARPVFDGELHALYYDLPGGLLKKAGKMLRLRREGDHAVLTLKADLPGVTTKVRREIEAPVPDFAAMRLILEEAGFAPWLEMLKHRSSYELNDCRIEIDQYRGDFAFIPEFLEIEGRDGDAVFGAARLLGFGPDVCVPWDAVELADHYRKRPGRRP